MTTTVAQQHQEHGHRYAHSHHPHHFDPDEMKIVDRDEATTCEHKFMHTADGGGEQCTTETVQTLIAHLEQHSLDWVAKFTAQINGGNGGLKQKFAFHRTQPFVGDARADADTPIAILENRNLADEERKKRIEETKYDMPKHFGFSYEPAKIRNVEKETAALWVEDVKVASYLTPMNTTPLSLSPQPYYPAKRQPAAKRKKKKGK